MVLIFYRSSHQEMESISPPLEAGHGHETCFGHWHANKCDSRNKALSTGACSLLLLVEYRHSVKQPRTAYWMLETCIQTRTLSPQTTSDLDHPAPQPVCQLPAAMVKPGKMRKPLS